MGITIKNIRIIDPANSTDRIGNLFIESGKITNVPSDGSIVIDGSGLVAAPGLVDMHVHLRDPGYTAKEDILTGCRAAAAGGVTSLLAMPNTDPTTDSPETVQYIINKAEKAAARVYVAASITKALKSLEMCDIPSLKAAGAIALTDDGRPVENTAFMAQAMVESNKEDMAVVAHCEDLYLAKGGKINEGEISRQLGIKGIPAAAEDCGTAREIALAAAYDVPIHICHVSTKTSVALIRDAKNRGVKVTAETAPHYFSMDETELLKRDADYRMNPPLRTAQDVAAIKDALKAGVLDAIATDHAPHTAEDKSDFVKAPNGSIGMETSLAATLTNLYHTGELTLDEIIRLMSLNPAKILNIPAGTLSVGANADVVVFNPDEEWTVDTDKLHGRSKNCPFKGKTLKGKVKYTILGGEIVYNDKEN
ncbi:MULTISPECIES: dihydroorotase [unclassified Ruminococcus]|uniref:dihydroorotase n=1 Tax=unclassified Ruminococcus TaxID=2608920 RepID=UPI00210BCD7D|nr:MULTISPECIES: dihydroorotase [unclassified Ruminococcus]MCQ4021552.1 amidohydrolase family protein [Ruminococcus sp. zg-924]MCQ4113997.1 amidohydrolase family protein [Ruminococcus sp. zg-921]